MKVIRRALVSGIIFSMIFVFASCLLAQEAGQEAAPAEAKPIEWVWGEVISVDAGNKQIVLKHLDYDTYEEVQTTLNVGDKTLFENVAALEEIRAGNHLTADFKVVAGSNIADLVVVEKGVQEDSAEPETAVETETAGEPEIVVAPETEVAPQTAVAPETTVAPETAVTPVPLLGSSEAPAAISAQAVMSTPEAAVTPVAVNETAPSNVYSL
jgi:Cu/Ag efflux protein CusF